MKERAITIAARAAFQAGCATIDRDRSRVDEAEHDRQIDALCKRLKISTLEYFDARGILAACGGGT